MRKFRPEIRQQVIDAALRLWNTATVPQDAGSGNACHDSAQRNAMESQFPETIQVQPGSAR